jgi:hypothetical protein
LFNHANDEDDVIRQPPAPAYRGPDRRASSLREIVGYRGPDRRGPSPAIKPHPLRFAVFALVAIVIGVLAIRATVIGGRAEVVTFSALRDSSAGLLVLSGTVSLVNWALTGRAARALDGSGLLLVGAGVLMLAGPWAAFVHQDLTTILISPACRLAIGIPAVALLVRSPSVVPIDSSVRPLRILTIAAACSLGLLAVEALVRLAGPLDRSAVWIPGMVLLSVGWVVAGVRRIILAASPRSVTGELMLGWSFIVIGAGGVLLAVAFDAGLRWGVAGVAVQLVGAAGAAGVSVAWLMSVLSRDGNRKLRLAGELADVTTVLADEQTVRHQLVHDARNLVAAIRTATITLERHGDRLDPDVQGQLQAAVGTEFARLQELLETPPI